jgi:anti-sigma regulatory factor (Ser/Thr protein kinase)
VSRLSVSRTFPARPSALRDVRGFIRERAHESSFDQEVADDLVLAVSEACANSVRHSGCPTIEVNWYRTMDGAEVEVMDGGVFRPPDPGPFAPPGLGFGIPMMRVLVDEVVIGHGTEAHPGTRVTLVMRRRKIQWSGPEASRRRE